MVNSLLRRLQNPAFGVGPSLSRAERALYAINHSYPFSSNGYAVRTHRVARALIEEGLDIIAASRPGLPWDQGGHFTHEFGTSHVIDGVRYVHLPVPSKHDGTLEQYLGRSVDAFSALIRVFKPAAVIAASDWRNALPPAISAHELGIPFLYEVRGFWEVSKAAKRPEWADSDEFRRQVELERTLARAARKVFTLNRWMRDELIRRGIPADRIELVPNGFPGWSSPPADTLSRADAGIAARYVVGYIGSFNAYEGLEMLIEALALLRNRGIDVALLLVGSGEPSGFGAGQLRGCPVTKAYSQLAEKLGVGDFLFMPGRVTPAQIDAYYALLDIVAIPRRPLPVCELVPPLKPLEAAAHGKRVLLSDVAPLAELGALCSSFSYFEKGNVQDLADRLAELLAAEDFAPPRCENLATLTWERNVAPMAKEIRECSLSASHNLSAKMVRRLP